MKRAKRWWLQGRRSDKNIWLQSDFVMFVKKCKNPECTVCRIPVSFLESSSLGETDGQNVARGRGNNNSYRDSGCNAG